MLITTCCLCGANDGAIAPAVYRSPPPLSGASLWNGLYLRRCACGAQHQYVNMSEEEYRELYRSGRYHECFQLQIGRQTYEQRYHHDRHVAVLRLSRYGLPAGASILDVGAGNAAFVDEAQAQGHNAWGIEPGEMMMRHGRIIPAFVEEVDMLDVDAWDVITLHDVLEHVIDPAAALRRLRTAGTMLLLDWPDFWASDGSGAHHWRPVQHLWLLTVEQLRLLLQNTGWVPIEEWAPIPGKVVLRCV